MDTSDKQSCFIFGSMLPKMIDPKQKIKYITELVFKMFEIKLNIEQLLTKYLSLY